MKSIEFLKEKLTFMHKVLPNIGIQYEFRTSTATHIIEIEPLHTFENDKNYIDAEIALEKEFSNNFPSEEVLFASDDSLTRVIAPNLTLCKNIIPYKFYPV